MSCSLRTKDEYDRICDLLEEETTLTSFNSTTNGINNSSPLNKLKYFHVCNFGLPPDVMQDLLEGYVPYTMKLLLNHLINNEKLFTVQHLNNLILHFNYGGNDARNKPNCLTTRELLSEDHGLNQSGKINVIFSLQCSMLHNKETHTYRTVFWLYEKYDTLCQCNVKIKQSKSIRPRCRMPTSALF